jgi:hypothetical protein
LVVGAFYHDKNTNRLIINNVFEKTPYYFSAYAVDKVGRYHREGVHAYSLPTGEFEKSVVDVKAWHDVALELVGGVRPSTKTGLSHIDYTQKISFNDEEYSFVINGGKRNNI